jgi:hypothetical protein
MQNRSENNAQTFQMSVILALVYHVQLQTE